MSPQEALTLWHLSPPPSVTLVMSAHMTAIKQQHCQISIWPEERKRKVSGDRQLGAAALNGAVCFARGLFTAFYTFQKNRTNRSTDLARSAGN